MKYLSFPLSISLIGRLVGIFGAYLLLGWLLKLYQATTLIWLFTYFSILYLSWSGTGAIAIVIFLIFMIIGISFFQIKAVVWFQNFLALNNASWFQALSAQIFALQTPYFKPTSIVMLWIVMFVFIWLLGTGIAFYHGFTQVFVEDKLEQRLTVFFLLSFIGILGLKLGLFLL